MERRHFLSPTKEGAETLGWMLARGVLAAALGIVCIIEVGFDPAPIPQGWFLGWEAVLLLGLLGVHVAAMTLGKGGAGWIRGQWAEIAILLAAVVSLFAARSWSLAIIALLVIYILSQTYLSLAQLVIRFSLLFVGSFALLIFIGALLLMLPRATPPGNPITFLDALFTSTSAVCVTGLIVRDTATDFTRFGQTIIILLVQLGGLGIIIFGALLATMLSGSMSVKHASNIQEVVGTVEGGPGNVERLVRFIVIATLVVEAIAAALLFIGWSPELLPEGLTIGDRMYYGVFISISAFCNAGFSVFSDSLVGFRYHWTSHIVVGLLITLGGLGFPVLYNLWQVAAARLRVRFGRLTRRELHRQRLVRFNLHTKVVLATSLAVFLLGTAGIFLSQLAHREGMPAGEPQRAASPEPLSAGEIGRLTLDSSFMCIAARTAGFNTMNMHELTMPSRYVLMMLMWVGGSPGGTAGGVKTTVLAVLLLTIVATLRNREETEVLGRSLPEALIRRAGALVMLGFVVISLVVLGLTITETGDFETQLFEAVSATATVGLSLGLTGDLSEPGRVIIMMAMFLGRVGPLALIGAVVFARAEASRYRYPSETMMLG